MSFTIACVLFPLLLALARGDTGLCNQTCPTGQTDYFVLPAYGGYRFQYIHTPGQPQVQSVQSTAITTGIIVIHGDSEDANDYWCYMNWAVEEARQSNSVYIFAPHFTLLSQDLANNTMFWTTGTWMEGGASSPTQSTRIASFTILDNVLVNFCNKTLFPSLTEILVVGHSAGGQTSHLYAISTAIDSTIAALGVKLRYIAENPGSYCYLDTNRPHLPAITLPTCTACNSTQIVAANWTFGAVNQTTAACSDYNDWKFGFTSPLAYTAARVVSDMQSQYKNKDVTYVLGTLDTCNNALGTCPCNDSTLDTSCSAQLQGYCRYMRGWAYYRYLQFFYGTTVHKIYTVPGIGHDGCYMLTNNVTLGILFPSAVAARAVTSELIR